MLKVIQIGLFRIEEIVLLGGLYIEVATYSEEHKIRLKIGNAIRQHYAFIGDNDFGFLRASIFQLQTSKTDCWPGSPLPKTN